MGASQKSTFFWKVLVRDIYWNFQRSGDSNIKILEGVESEKSISSPRVKHSELQCKSMFTYYLQSTFALSKYNWNRLVFIVISTEVHESVEVTCVEWIWISITEHVPFPL